MPVTELATFQLKAGLDVSKPDSSEGRVWKDICNTVSQQNGFQSLYYGPGVESPNMLQLFVSWDTFESHKKFMASPGYGAMVDKLKTFLAGEPHFIHYDYPGTGSLTSALSAPVTELATFYLPSKSSSWEANANKFAKIAEDSASGVLGVSTAWSIEDVEHEGFGAGVKGKAFLLAIGWQSLDAHMAFRETEAFKNGVYLLRSERKGAEMHHVAIHDL